MSLPATLDQHKDDDSSNDESEYNSLEASSEKYTSSSTAAEEVSSSAMSESGTLEVKTISETKELNKKTKEMQESMETAALELLPCNRRECLEEQSGNQESGSKEVTDAMKKGAGHRAIEGDTVTLEKPKQCEDNNKSKQDDEKGMAESDNVTTSLIISNNRTKDKESLESKDKVGGGQSKACSTVPETTEEAITTTMEDSTNKDKVSGVRSKDETTVPDTPGNAMTTTMEDSTNKDKVSGERSKDLTTVPETTEKAIITSVEDSANKDKGKNRVTIEGCMTPKESKPRATDGKDVSKGSSNSEQQNMNTAKPSPNLSGGNDTSNKMAVAAQEAGNQKESEVPVTSANDPSVNDANNTSSKNQKKAAGQNSVITLVFKSDVNEPKTGPPNKKDNHDKINENIKKDPENSNQKEGKTRQAKIKQRRN
ncbi:hypothetical protein PRIEUP_LOCUS1024 [Pristimantis euphronides]